MITFEFHQSIFMRQTICLLLMVAATAIAATSSYAEVSVTFGIYASEKPTEMVIQFRPVLNLMEKELSKKLNDNVKIKIKISKEYEDGITQIVDGNVDISRLGPASFVTATQKNPALTLLALEGKKGKKVFNGVICVRAESNITSVEQLRGKSFAFGDSLSTIGRYLSQEYLLRHGIRSKDLARFEYLERHDVVGTAVAHGKFDAGALKEGTFKDLLAAGEKLHSIATFPNVTKPWVARKGLNPQMVEALKATLLEVNDASALAPLKIDGFVEGSEEDFSFIRKAMEVNEQFFQ